MNIVEIRVYFDNTIENNKQSFVGRVKKENLLKTSHYIFL